MTKIAGIFLVRKDNKILLCHPTKHSPNFWSIPKGRVDKGEELLDTALRETYEETNIDLSKWRIIHNLEPVEYDTTDKVLHCYVIFENQNNFDFNSFELKCNSNVSPEKGGFPEMDDYKWVDLKEAKPMLHTAQMMAIEQLQKLMNKLEKKRKEFGPKKTK
jgi:8-oxo-dGTP pyrophosphatase MutT (NUDIX family)